MIDDNKIIKEKITNFLNDPTVDDFYTLSFELIKLEVYIITSESVDLSCECITKEMFLDYDIYLYTKYVIAEEDRFMAAFIDKEEATIFKPSGCKLYKIFLIDLINEKIMNDEKINGIVIDPFTKPLNLNKELLSIINYAKSLE